MLVGDEDILSREEDDDEALASIILDDVKGELSGTATYGRLLNLPRSFPRCKRE